ncbi:hypothetical protein DRQ26_02885 [bacterium]|nr:MAG: hypothetical protein DRQ26_02885 [bacterium]
MRIFIGKKLVLEQKHGTTVQRVMEILGLLEEEYLPYNPKTALPTTPDFRIPDNADFLLLPVYEAGKTFYTKG